MAPTSPPHEADDLVEHGRFVRRLALSLLHDEDAADDVVQETMLAATRSPPDPSRPIRPWLATVARNVIRKRFRSKDRVRRREEAAARPERLPATADMVARAEMLRQVVDAVLSLEEPNRSTVLLRFYENLPPREIAKRQGVGVETVRGRIKRAVKQLRARLDAQHPGGRRAWAPILAGLAGMEVPAHLLASGSGTGTGAGTAGLAADAAPAAASGTVSLAAAFVVGVGVAGVVGTLATRPSPPPAARGEVAAAPDRRPGGPGLRGDPDARLRRLASERTALEEEVAGLRAHVAALEARLPPPTVFRFGLPEGDDAFSDVEWMDVARHIRGLTPLIPRLVRYQLQGRSIPPELLAETQRHQAPVSAFAVELDSAFESLDANLAFTQPPVVANLIRAVLLLAEDPLTPAQETAIRALGEAWAEETRRLEDWLGPDALALERRIAEVETRRRFLDATKDVLTGSQRAVLFDPETEDRVQLDVFSPVLAHNMRVGAHAPDRAALERTLLTKLFELAGVKVEDPSPYTWVARDWVDALPDVQVPRDVRDRDLLFTHIDDAQRWARAQAEAMRRILGMGRLAPTEAKALREVTMLVVPRIARN